MSNFELYSIITYYFWFRVKLLDHWLPALRTVGVFHLPQSVFFKLLTNETAVLYKSLPRHPLHMTQECGFINNLPLEEEHTYIHLFISIKKNIWFVTRLLSKSIKEAPLAGYFNNHFLRVSFQM